MSIKKNNENLIISDNFNYSDSNNSEINFSTPTYSPSPPIILGTTPPSPPLFSLNSNTIPENKTKKVSFNNITNISNIVKKSSPSAKIGNYIYFYPPIGRGSSGKVYSGICSDTKEIIAVKKINNIALQKLSIERISNEMKMMKNLDHPNIIKYKDIIKDNNYVYMITEYCNGGNLKKFIDDYSGYPDKFDEYEIKIFMRQIRDALQYLHSKNIYHRDIKPQNIFIQYKNGLPMDYNDMILKIGDFGFAKEIYEDDMENTLCGTPLYIAPEIILEKKYNINSDLWSIGVMLFQLYYNDFPYGKARNILELIKNINTYKLELPLKKYKNVSISLEGCELLNGLLEKNPLDRITWDEFFNHAWFVFRDEKFDPEIDTDSEDEDNSEEIDKLANNLDLELKDIINNDNLLEKKKKKEDKLYIIDDYCDKFNNSSTISLPIDISKKQQTPTPIRNNNIGKNIYRFLTSSIENLRKYANG